VHIHTTIAKYSVEELRTSDAKARELRFAGTINQETNVQRHTAHADYFTPISALRAQKRPIALPQTPEY